MAWSAMTLLGVLGWAWGVLYLLVIRLVPADAVPRCLDTRLRRSRLAASVLTGLSAFWLFMTMLDT